MEWKDLSIRDRATLIHNGVQKGLTSIGDIKHQYGDGGYLDWLKELATEKAKEWGVTPERAYSQMLKDDEDSYFNYYKESPTLYPNHLKACGGHLFDGGGISHS